MNRTAGTEQNMATRDLCNPLVARVLQVPSLTILRPLNLQHRIPGNGPAGYEDEDEITSAVVTLK